VPPLPLLVIIVFYLQISLADIVVFVALQHAAVVYPEVMSENEWIEEFVNKMTMDRRICQQNDFRREIEKIH